MSLSLKEELDTWSAALEAFDRASFPESVELFTKIENSSKIQTNIGLIYATMGEHQMAVDRFNDAIRLDNYHAIAHFQCGVSNFILGRYEHAYANFNDTFFHLRGNTDIRYQQLGLRFCLFSAEVLFNRGLSQIMLGHVKEGTEDVREASKQKMTEEHDVINEALDERCARYTVFSIPYGVVYRPPENKVKNSKTKDYLGKAKLVALSDADDASTDFSGTTKVRKSESSSDTTSSLTSNPETSADLKPSLINPLIYKAPKFNRNITEPVFRTSPSGNTSFERSSAISEPRTINDEREDKRWVAVQVPRSSSPLTPQSSKLPLFPSPSLQGKFSPEARQLLHRLQTSSQTYSPLLTSQSSQQFPRTPVSPAMSSLSRRSRSVSHVRVNMAGDELRRSNTLASVSPSHTMSPWQGSATMEGRADGGGMSQFALQEAEGSSLSSDDIAKLYSERGTRFSDESGGYTYGVANGSLGGPLALPHHRTTGNQQTNGHGAMSVSANVGTVVVKLHHQAEVRGMMLSASTDLSTFFARVAAKLDVPTGTLRLEFMDEDGVKTSLRDEEDWDLAMETATRAGQDRNTGRNGRRGRLDVFCEEN